MNPRRRPSRIRSFLITALVAAAASAGPGAALGAPIHKAVNDHSMNLCQERAFPDSSCRLSDLDLRNIRQILHDDPSAANAVDEDNPTPPLLLAVMSGDDEVAALLLAKGAKPDAFTAAARGDTDRLAQLLKDEPKLITAKIGEGETLLHIAVECRRLAAARLLLDRKAEVNAKAVGPHWQGATPLYFAVQNDDTAMAELLLAHGADASVKLEYPGSLLHEAASNRRPLMIALLLNHKLDVNVKDEHGGTPLNNAASSGQVENVKLLLDRGADINGGDLEHTPIFEAAEQGHLDAAELLRRRGAKLDLITAVRLGRVEEATALLKREKEKPLADRVLPLFSAVQAGNKELVRMLLDAGARVDAETFSDTGTGGDTPLHVAAAYGRRDVAELLLDRGAKIDALATGRDTPLHVAAQNGHADVVRLLLRRGSDLSRYGGQALMDAAQGGHKECVEVLLAELRAKGRPAILDGTLFLAALNRHKDVAEFLLAQGAGVRARSADGATPLHYAARTEDRPIVALLLDRGADVNAATDAGTTPLHESCHQMYGTTAEAAATVELLKRGAAVNQKDADGNTPLHVAAKYADIAVVRLLLEQKADAKIANKAAKLPWELADAEGQDEIADLLRKAAEKQTGAKDIRDKRRPTSGGLAVGTIVNQLAHRSRNVAPRQCRG